MGVGHHHHWEEEPKLYHHRKDKMVEGPTNLSRVVGVHHNHQMVGVGELAHHSWKGVEECLSDQWVGEELLHLVVMEVVMRMVMTMEGVIDHLPQGEMEEMVVMVVMMEMAVEEMIHHHCQIKGNHNAIKIRETNGYMWYKDHPDPRSTGTRWKGWLRWTNATTAQGNDKCPGSGIHSFGHYRFRKFL